MFLMSQLKEMIIGSTHLSGYSKDVSAGQISLDFLELMRG